MKGRLNRFTIACAVFYLALLVALHVVSLVMDERGDDTGLIIALLGIVIGGPLAVGASTLVVFGARGRAGDAGWTVVIGGVVLITLAGMLGQFKPLLHGTRWVVRGTARGSVAEIARSNASYVEASPALLDLSRIGHGRTSSTDSKGKTSTTLRYVAPVVTALGERDDETMRAEQIHLFVCDDDKDDLLDHGEGAGTIAGRISAPDDAETLAIQDSGVEHLATPHRCITLTYGGGTTTGVFWLVITILIVAVGTLSATFGAFVLVPHK